MSLSHALVVLPSLKVVLKAVDKMPVTESRKVRSLGRTAKTAVDGQDFPAIMRDVPKEIIYYMIKIVRLATTAVQAAHSW